MPKKQRLKYPEAVVAISAENQRENELQEARAIRLAMLASEPMHTTEISVESEFQPFSEVGGDFLDYISVVRRNGGIVSGRYNGRGLPSALFAALAGGTTGLEAGDSVVFLSDGLVGAMTEQGELLGLERVAEILTGCREKPPRAILEAALFRKGEIFEKAGAAGRPGGGGLRYLPSSRQET